MRYNYKGGRYTNGTYIRVLKRNHPKSGRYGYIFEHRLIYEESRNCCLLPWADIHHLDGNKHNNIWYNLQAMSHAKHIHLEHLIDMTNRVCSKCTSTGRQNWHYQDNGLLICSSCYDKERRGKNKEHIKEYNKRYHKKYYQRNKEYVKRRAKEYYHQTRRNQSKTIF